MEVIKVCFKFNTGFINFVSILLSIFIVSIFSFGIGFIKNQIPSETHSNQVEITSKKSEEIETSTKEEILEVNDNLEKTNEFDWYIEIPKIKLYAPIEEGTDEEILNRSIGHFEDTSRRNGNCGLAAHNRGYRVNYFANVKDLEKGDTIFYFVDGKKYEYVVSEIVIIYETDWSMLEETGDCKITLITCVENRPEYRLCVQGSLVEN